MYENLAWENFIKTGNIESYLEYKNLINLKQELTNKNDGGICDIDETC